MSKPATVLGVTVATGTDPGSLKTSGWAPGAKVAAQHFNWLLNITSIWIDYLNAITSEVLTWASKHTFSAGLTIPIGQVSATTDGANKKYVDDSVVAHTGLATAAHAGSAIANTPAGTIVATDVQGALNGLDTTKMPKGGGAFTGAPIYASDPGTGDTLSRKSYVDTQVGLQMPKTGGTFSAAPMWAADPVGVNDLTRKSYVDTQVGLQMPKTGGAFTGQPTFTADPVNPNDLVRKNYVDNLTTYTEAGVTGLYGGGPVTARKSNGRVCLRGSCLANFQGGFSSSVGMLPAGYKPAAEREICIPYYNSGSAQWLAGWVLAIEATGNMYVKTTNNGTFTISMDGVTFDV
jgi:hypothetical protein